MERAVSGNEVRSKTPPCVVAIGGNGNIASHGGRIKKTARPRRQTFD